MNDKGSFSPQPSPLNPTFSSFPVLVLDDEPLALRVAEIMLQAAGIKPVITLSDSRELMSRLAKQPVAVLLLDLTMPHLTGEELLPEVTAKYPDLPVVVCTGANDVETAVHCMQAGAFDYIVK
ncbi:TPA: two-component system response regulator, partial [Candidatus Sumerlaeota bacterium]|nr:two-component system response regulator [Candidatus Sumerlaeota bacterium]